MIEILKEFVFRLPERLGYSSQIMVLGLAVVFTGLCILIGCILLLSALISLKKGKKAAPAKEAPVVVPAPVAEKAAAQTGASADELVAVITAALMAYTASEGTAASGKKLIVRNIRAAKPAAWARAGRADQINSRF